MVVSFKDPRVLAAVGSGMVLLFALLLLTFCVASGRHAAPPPEAVRHGVLQVQVGKQDTKLDPAKPLRCFVGGQFVGELPLIDCAKKNGVAAQNLDVGLDQTGQMAAAQVGGQTALSPPLKVTPTTAPATVAGAALGPAPAVPSLIRAPPIPTVSTGPVGQCLRFAGGEWRETGASISLQACVHALYEGRCVHAGDAAYARFGGQTLRLVPGKVEISSDNRNFRTLVEQASDCSLP